MAATPLPGKVDDKSMLPIPGNGMGASKQSLNTSEEGVVGVESNGKSCMVHPSSSLTRVFSSTHKTNRAGVSPLLLLLLLLLSSTSPVCMPTARSINGAFTQPLAHTNALASTPSSTRARNAVGGSVPKISPMEW